MFIDSEVDGADIFAGTDSLAPGGVIPVHWHDAGEAQFILSGVGVAIDEEGNEQPVGPFDTVYSPAGRGGAHGFRNDGNVPLTILFMYGSPGGVAPRIQFIRPRSSGSPGRRDARSSPDRPRSRS